MYAGTVPLLQKRKADNSSGYEPWGTRCSHYTLPSGRLALVRRSHILKPNVSEGASEDCLMTWEDEVSRREGEPSTKLPGEVAIVRLCWTGAQGHLREHFRLAAASLTRYSDVEEVSESHFKPRQVFSGRSAKKIPGVYRRREVRKGQNAVSGNGPRLRRGAFGRLPKDCTSSPTLTDCEFTRRGSCSWELPCGGRPYSDVESRRFQSQQPQAPSTVTPLHLPCLSGGKVGHKRSWPYVHAGQFDDLAGG